MQKSFADVNDFFPHGTTIHVGDSVKFVPTGFHTVDFPAKGGKPLGLIAPAGTTSGVLDAAGAPFWFNGQPTLGFTPALGPPGLYGKKVTYTGAKRVESGAAGAEAEAVHGQVHQGRHVTYYCNIHSGMKGTVKVVSKSHSVPSAKADAKTLKAQVSSALSTANALTKTKVAPGNSASARPARVASSPSRCTPRPDGPGGTTIKFSMSAKSYEVHTATSAPATPRPSRRATSATSRTTSPTTRCSRLRPSTRAIRRRRVRQRLTPTLHGNGFWNSGLLDVDKATPLPPSKR